MAFRVRLRSPPWARRAAWPALLVLLTLLVLTGAWLRHSPCLDHPWNGHQYERHCYNDIQVIYHIRGLGEGKVPYLEAFNEYPVLTGMAQFFAASVTRDEAGYVHVTWAVLGAAAVATTLLIAARPPTPRRPLLWALGPPLFLYAFHNWDLLAVALATGGLVAYRRGRVRTAGVLLGLGGAAKLYPLLLAPVLAADLFRAETRPFPRTTAFAAAAAAGWAAPNLPVLLADPSGWWATYVFHAGRDPNYETTWAVLRTFCLKRGWDTVAGWFQGPVFSGLLLAAFAAGSMGIAARVLRGRIDAVRGAFATLLLFLVLNKVYSVQYTLWLLPFLVLLAVPWPRTVALLVADAAVFWTVFGFFAAMGTPGEEGAAAWLAAAVLTRTAALVFLLSWAVRPAQKEGAARLS